jgi:hypothetical protein
MECAKDDFTISMGIRRMDITLDYLIMQEAIDNIRSLPFRRADDGMLPEEVAFIEKGVDTHP